MHSVQERVKNTLLRTLYTFLSNFIFIFYARWSKVLNETILDFFLKHAHIFLKIIILKCKVFKLKRFSSVTWHVYVKHMWNIMFMWHTLFRRWISSKNLQKLKNVLPKKILIGLVTKLENLFFVGRIYKKSPSRKE